MPLIVVGNIVIGGTGKTPMVIWITKLLEKMVISLIVSRGYGGSSPKNPIMVNDDTSVDVSGDEPLIIYKNTKDRYASSNRISAADKLIRETDTNIIISDDGLQHYGDVKRS